VLGRVVCSPTRREGDPHAHAVGRACAFDGGSDARGRWGEAAQARELLAVSPRSRTLDAMRCGVSGIDCTQPLFGDAHVGSREEGVLLPAI
jgi:hypothetical protein